MPLVEGLLETAAKDRTTVHGWCLSGLVSGVRVNVRVVNKSVGTGGGGHHETQVEALFDPPLELGLKITNEGLVSRMAQKLTGRHDLQTGNLELDNLIHVKAESPDAAQSLLADLDVQQRLLDAYRAYPSPTITDKGAALAHYGFEKDLDVLKKSLDAVAGLVSALSPRKSA